MKDLILVNNLLKSNFTRSCTLHFFNLTPFGVIYPFSPTSILKSCSFHFSTAFLTIREPTLLLRLIIHSPTIFNVFLSMCMSSCSVCWCSVKPSHHHHDGQSAQSHHLCATQMVTARHSSLLSRPCRWLFLHTSSFTLSTKQGVVNKV